RRLWRRNVLRPDPEHLMEIEGGPSDDERRRDNTDDEAELLVDRCRPDEVTRLQVLGRSTGIRRRDTDHRTDAEGDGPVLVARPANRDKQQAGEDERRDRHPRDRVRRRADEAGDTRRYGDE